MLNFETFYLISIPGFVVGIMTGRFFTGHHWQNLSGRTGNTARLIGRLFFLGYLVSIPLILGIMLIYLIHLPAVQPAKIAITLLAALWMVANLVLEIVNLVNHRSSNQPSASGAASSSD